MNVTESTLAGLDRAADQAEDLRRGLLDRQGDLLELEKNVRALRGGRGDGALLIDQAEDARRTIRDHQQDQLSDIRGALTRADDMVATAAADGVLDRDQARVLAHVVNIAGEEGRRAIGDLDQVTDALTSTAQASPDDPDLARTAQRGVDQAASNLEKARRAAFRISDDLPLIASAVRDMPGHERAATPQLVLARAPEEHPAPGARIGYDVPEPGVGTSSRIGEARAADLEPPAMSPGRAAATVAPRR